MTYVGPALNSLNRIAPCSGMEAATVNLIYSLRWHPLLQAWDPQRHTCPYRADELLDSLEAIVGDAEPQAEIERIVAELRPLAVLGAASADWASVEQAKAWLTSHPGEADEFAKAVRDRAKAEAHLDNLCERLGLPKDQSHATRHTCPTPVRGSQVAAPGPFPELWEPRTLVIQAKLMNQASLNKSSVAIRSATDQGPLSQEIWYNDNANESGMFWPLGFSCRTVVLTDQQETPSVEIRWIAFGSYRISTEPSQSVSATNPKLSIKGARACWHSLYQEGVIEPPPFRPRFKTDAVSAVVTNDSKFDATMTLTIEGLWAVDR